MGVDKTMKPECKPKGAHEKIGVTIAWKNLKVDVPIKIPSLFARQSKQQHISFKTILNKGV